MIINKTFLLTINHQTGRFAVLALQRNDTAGVAAAEAGRRVEQAKCPVARPLVAGHHKVLVDVGAQLLGKGRRALAGGDPLEEGLLLLVEEPLDDDHRVVVRVGKVAVEDDAGGGRGEETSASGLARTAILGKR